MNPLTLGLISFLFILGGTLLGFYLGHRLPQAHVSSDSKETVKMAWGMVATMSALVLSLLVASAKSSFDTVSNENTQAAAKIVMLEHTLLHYGPEAAGARQVLRQSVLSTMASDTDEEEVSETPAALDKANGLEQLEEALGQLKPATDDQRALLSHAKAITDELFQARVLVIEQSHTFLPNVLLFAPRNKTVVVTLLLCCVSLSFAIFLINDLNHPLHGIVTVSKYPMREALDYLNHY
jgi:hypothetical protein